MERVKATMVRWKPRHEPILPGFSCWTTAASTDTGSRKSKSTIYIPLALLIHEDLTAALGTTTTLRLKEVVVVVPDGYSRDKTIDPQEMEERQGEDEEEWEEERKIESEQGCAAAGSSRRALPIVQAIYFIYLKR